MIDFYLKNESLKTESKIGECYEYYLNKDLSYDDIYEEYDRIMNLKPKIEYSDQNIFIKAKKLVKITTCFMKECVLESLKRLIEIKCDIDIKDPDSELNIEDIKMVNTNLYTQK